VIDGVCNHVEQSTQPGTQTADNGNEQPRAAGFDVISAVCRWPYGDIEEQFKDHAKRRNERQECQQAKADNGEAAEFQRRQSGFVGLVVSLV